MKRGFAFILFLLALNGISTSFAQTNTCIAGNCQDGYGAMQYDNGKYEGHFANGLKDGKGAYTWTSGIKYDGDWVAGQMNGKGTIIFEDGKKYTGEVVNGVANNNGTYYMADGSVDTTRGYGKKETPVAPKNPGCTYGDCQKGFGIFKYPSGEKYEGYYLDGQRHGLGTYTWLSGEKYVGNWAKGVMDGNGKYTNADGSKYVGEFKEGVITNNGIFYTATGSIDRTRGYGKTASGNKTSPEASDDFSEMLLDLLNQCEYDFSDSQGEELTDETAANKIGTYECYSSFTNALKSRIFVNYDYDTYSYVSEFYHGKSKKEATQRYAEILQLINEAVVEPTYTFKEEPATQEHLKSIVVGMKKGTTVQRIATANLRLDVINGEYVVLIQIENKDI